MPSQTPLTDSVWLWIAVFLVGALGALTLSIPKYRWRQSQLEHQYDARVASGHATDLFPGEGPDPLATDDEEEHGLRVTIRPLLYLLVAGIFVATFVFWMRLFREPLPVAESMPKEPERGIA